MNNHTNWNRALAAVMVASTALALNPVWGLKDATTDIIEANEVIMAAMRDSVLAMAPLAGAIAIGLLVANCLVKVRDPERLAARMGATAHAAKMAWRETKAIRWPSLQDAVKAVGRDYRSYRELGVTRAKALGHAVAWLRWAPARYANNVLYRRQLRQEAVAMRRQRKSFTVGEPERRRERKPFTIDG